MSIYNNSKNYNRGKILIKRGVREVNLGYNSRICNSNKSYNKLWERCRNWSKSCRKLGEKSRKFRKSFRNMWSRIRN